MIFWGIVNNLIIQKKMLLIGFLLLIIPLSLLFWFTNLLSFMFSDTQEPWQIISPTRWTLAVIIPLFMIQSALKKKSIDQTGASMGFLVGFVLTLSNYCFVAALFAFFVTASKATKFRSHLKRKFEDDFKEGGQRNWVQVLCNGGVATELAILYMIDRGCGEYAVDFSKQYMRSWLCMAVLGALCCCSGDTYASEIGSVVGGWDPRLITTLRKVPRGTNGAVSFVGVVSSILGGLVVGLAYYAMLVSLISTDQLASSPPQWPIIVMAAFSGFLGSLIDSYLGAILQYSGYHKDSKVIVEHPGPDIEHISGLTILDNHGINLLSSIITALITPKLAFHFWGYVT